MKKGAYVVSQDHRVWTVLVLDMGSTAFNVHVQVILRVECSLALLAPPLVWVSMVRASLVVHIKRVLVIEVLVAIIAIVRFLTMGAVEV